jgi:hypothetical protein
MNAADRDRLRQVRAAILGNRPDESLSNALYPAYVAVIAAGAYGIPAAQQLFRSLDEKWLAAHAWTPVGALVAAAFTAFLLTLVWLVGRVHGPVVPPLPYLELVVASPMPRKVTLARNWRLSLAGSAIGGLLVGTVGGGGLAIAGVTSAVVLLPTALGGCLLGVLVAELWLRGQLKGGLVLGLEDSSSRMSRIAKAELLYDELLSVDEVIGRVDAVGLDDVHALAKGLFSQKQTLAVVGPFARLPR